MDIYDDLGFKQQTNLRAATDGYETFGNGIRSYRQKGLLQPIEKNGVRLILNGKNLIQYLLIQRFLFLGAKLGELIEVIPAMSDENLQYLILAETLSLSDLPMLSPSISILKPSANIDNAMESSFPIWHHLSISKDIILNINAKKYSSRNFDKLKVKLKEVLDNFEF